MHSNSTHARQCARSLGDENRTEHIQNSAQETNVTKNRTEHIKNSARGTNVPNNHTEHIQNGAQSTNVTTNLKKTQ